MISQGLAALLNAPTKRESGAMSPDERAGAAAALKAALDRVSRGK